MAEEKNKRFTASDSIELRSEQVQEILGRPPHWIIRWGIAIVFIIVIVLLVGSYFFKYPNIITATITITTENLPASIIAKSSGRIDTLLVQEKQSVRQGDLLSIIENTACFKDVLKLKTSLANYNIQEINYSTRNPLSDFSFLNSAQLGDIQPFYQQFIKAYEDYHYFILTGYHRKKITVIENQIQTQKEVAQKLKKQLHISNQQLAIAYQLFIMDSTLFATNALSNVEYQVAKNSYLQQLQSNENTKLGIDNQNLSILQSEQTIFDLEQQRNEQQNNLQIALTGAYNQLQTQIKNWEQTYLLVSPISGMVTLTKYWQKNQNINAGEVLISIIPHEETKIIGKISLPLQGAGKVKEGQLVNVKIDNFPYMEFGVVRGEIKNISLVPIAINENQKAYLLSVDFPEKLRTNYGNELGFSQEMSGSAEIITEDLRLLDKFLNPIKSVINGNLK
ncbi:MAG: HlyD family secretion protein [Lentimicrobiaceae bacterium]|jgi:HlyD family secretion protein|nr:HlyD family secretion protein [Lentimicrobiaceae bacterium]